MVANERRPAGGETEKVVRIRYQDLVYRACTIVENALSRSRRHTTTVDTLLDDLLAALRGGGQGEPIAWMAKCGDPECPDPLGFYGQAHVHGLDWVCGCGRAGDEVDWYPLGLLSAHGAPLPAETVCRCCAEGVAHERVAVCPTCLQRWDSHWQAAAPPAPESEP